MTDRDATRHALALTVALVMATLSGCGSLLPTGTAPPLAYSLDEAQHARAADPPATPSPGGPAIVVNPTRAAPGYDSLHLVYVRVDHQLEHFARSEWVDTPARMLAPLIVSALEHSGMFRAVGPVTSGMAADLRLDTEVLRLRQEFGSGPSRVRLTLRAALSDNATRQTLTWREFDVTVACTSEDAYGGVKAANLAVQETMEQLSGYAAQASRDWMASHPGNARASATATSARP